MRRGCGSSPFQEVLLSLPLSAPLYRLRREARRLARETSIPLHEALDRVAATQGFARWSLLVARHAAMPPAERLLAWLEPGDLLLIGARPGQGKTRLGLQLASLAARRGGRAVFFTLEWDARTVVERLRAQGADLAALAPRFEIDDSPAISAAHIVARLADAPRGTLAVVDYLQLLDQKRSNPELATQIDQLAVFARSRGVTLAFISQIDRRYDPAAKPLPDIGDVRLPNPLDLALFGKTCFLHGERFSLREAA
jgi:replicative DNA helicase